MAHCRDYDIEGMSYDAFLTHTWREDTTGRDNHARVSMINEALKKEGLMCWFDSERLKGRILDAMCEGIDASRVVVVFITEAYLEKVNGSNANDNCKLEFEYARLHKSPTKMIAVVMETDLTKKPWTGPVGMALGGSLFVDFSEDSMLQEAALKIKHQLELIESNQTGVVGNTVRSIIKTTGSASSSSSSPLKSSLLGEGYSDKDCERLEDLISWLNEISDISDRDASKYATNMFLNHSISTISKLQKCVAKFGQVYLEETLGIDSIDADEIRMKLTEEDYTFVYDTTQGEYGNFKKVSQTATAVSATAKKSDTPPSPTSRKVRVSKAASPRVAAVGNIQVMKRNANGSIGGNNKGKKFSPVVPEDYISPVDLAMTIDTSHNSSICSPIKSPDRFPKESKEGDLVALGEEVLNLLDIDSSDELMTGMSFLLGEGTRITSATMYRNFHPIYIQVVNDDKGLFIASQGSLPSFIGGADSAIINTTNTYALGGGGCDDAVNGAGGIALCNARENLPLYEAKSECSSSFSSIFTNMYRCAVGDAVVTIAGNIKTDFVIHSVGPNYRSEGLERGDKLLKKAYQSSMLRAQERNLKTLAFCLISAGVFRGNQSLANVLTIGKQTILEEWYEGLQEVHMVCYTQREAAAMRRCFDAEQADSVGFK